LTMDSLLRRAAGPYMVPGARCQVQI
jgi:hypothetical protein